MERGTVKWFFDAKGTASSNGAGRRGRIRPLPAIHMDGYGALGEGVTVEFDIRETKGLPKNFLRNVV